MQKLLFLLFLISFSTIAQDSSKVIYGVDNREDVVNTFDNLMIENLDLPQECS